MYPIVMPRVDPAMQSGIIVQWLKKEGEHVTQGEPVAVAEGEKTSFEIAAPASGILRRVLKSEGDEVTVSEEIALVCNPDEPLPEKDTFERVGFQERDAEARPIPKAGVVSSEGATARASPAARKRAAELGVDLKLVQGSGPRGRITSEDVEAFKASQGPTRHPPAPEVIGMTPRILSQSPLSGTRKTIAERMAYSAKTYPTAALMAEVDFTNLLTLRQKVEGGSAHASVTALVVKASAQALLENRRLNASLEEGIIRIYEDINIAVAVDAPEGLVAPVVFSADKLNAVEISRLIEELSTRARMQSLTVRELTGSTFTVTNLGGFGVDAFIPLINPPNAAILALGRMNAKPFLEGDKPTIRHTAMLTLVFDHRVVDGTQAAAFLNSIRAHIEQPTML